MIGNVLGRNPNCKIFIKKFLNCYSSWQNPRNLK
jgi:hypothetical protein